MNNMNLVFFIIILHSLGTFTFVAITECRLGFSHVWLKKIDKPPKAVSAFGGSYRHLLTFSCHEKPQKIADLLNPKSDFAIKRKSDPENLLRREKLNC